MILATERIINLFGYDVPLEMSWAEGMVGVIPAFETYEAAEKYRGDAKCAILEIEETEMEFVKS